MQMNKKIVFCAFVFACAVFLYACRGDTGGSGLSGPDGSSLSVMNFQDGVYPSSAYNGTADSYIESGAGSGTNYGSSEYLYQGYIIGSGSADRSVFKFDLSLLAGQSVIVKKAYLTVYVSQRTSVSDFTVTPHKVTPGWDEGQVAWAAGSPWIAAGGDFETAAAGMPAVMDAANVLKTFEINADVAQSWIDNPAQNYGLILVADSEAGGLNSWVSYISRNYSVTPSMRPRLTVYYAAQ